MDFIKNIIREAVREELAAQLEKQTAALVTILNAYTARLAQVEEALNGQTGALTNVAESLCGLAEIAVETRDYLFKDIDAADWWKGERG